MTATEKYTRSFSKDIYIESNTGSHTYEDNPVFPIYKTQFFLLFFFCPTFHSWYISVGYFIQEKRLTQDSTNEKAQGRTAESVPIRKCFPIEPGIGILNSHHYPAVRRYQSPSANPSLHSAIMQQMTTCCCYVIQLAQIAENYGVNYKFQHSQ